MAKKSGSGWGWALGLLGLGGLGLFLAKDAIAAGPASQESQAGKMLEAIKGLLTSKGFSTLPSYVTGTSETAEVVDTTGAGRVLSQTNQTITDNLHHFFWETNALLKFKNFPSTDTARWEKYLASYNKAMTDLAALA